MNIFVKYKLGLLAAIILFWNSQEVLPEEILDGATETPLTTTMYRIITSDVSEWVPPKRVRVRGFYSLYSGSMIWATLDDAKHLNFGAGLTIRDPAIVAGSSCEGMFFEFIGMIGVSAKDRTEPYFYDTEKFAVWDFVNSKLLHTKKSSPDTQGSCYLDEESLPLRELYPAHQNYETRLLFTLDE